MTTSSPGTITGNVALNVAGESMTVEVTVPAAATPLMALLPVFNGMASALVERAVVRDAVPGRAVSCRAACGACCRQPVPVAPSEARALAALVDALPEPRQSVIRARFADGWATLDDAGVRIRLDDLGLMEVDQRVRWVADYMRVGVSCPFLEAESCSIYPDRPTICREYLVTTPAENCREPGPGNIRRVPVPGAMSSAVAAVDRGIEDNGPMLLVDSLAWVAANPARTPARTGPDLVEAVFASLAKTS